MHGDAVFSAHLAQQDFQKAAVCLVEHYADDVSALCTAMAGADAADDLSQDAFSRAFGALRSFRGDASARTWLLRIARNRCIDHLRATQRSPFDDPDPADVDTQPAHEPRVDDLLARDRDLRAGLAVLSENERALVVLRFGHGLEYGELAEAFGLKEGACRMRVSRAVSKMRDSLLSPRLRTASVNLDALRSAVADEELATETLPPEAARPPVPAAEAPTTQAPAGLPRPSAPRAPAPRAPAASPPSFGAQGSGGATPTLTPMQGLSATAPQLRRAASERLLAQLVQLANAV
ncbi:MAG: sigma-70 family RNA polymerase sigma factor [Myxococcota bacterium]